MLRIYLSVAFLFAFAIQLQAQSSPTAKQWASVLNLSGRQRMLTQKMSKEALFISAGVKPEEMKSSLKGTVDLFESTLAGLKTGNDELGLPPTSDPDTMKQLEKVDGMFQELKPVFVATVSGSTLDKSALETLAKKNVPLLVEMNKAVKMYETAAKSVLGGDQKSAVVINLAGKQRMLTQKMTKEALLVRLGVDADANKKNLAATTSLFSRTLKGLVEGDGELGLPGTTDAEILAQLGKVKSIWQSVSPIVSSESPSEAQLNDLSVSNISLLKEMNKAVQMYAAAAK